MPDAPLLTHLAYDLAAYVAAVVLVVLGGRRAAARFPSPLPRSRRLEYYFVLTNGAIAGSLLFGSANLLLAGHGPAVGKSILGAIVGGIVAVESYKKIAGIRGSTGAAFVPGLAFGIAVGRLGCHAAGLGDFTHGVPTALPLGVDYGDGVPRHPVALYESGAMFAFALLSFVMLWRGSQVWWRRGFYFFAGFYGAQRFAWEFLKPYPDVLPGLNLFHLLAGVLVAYAVVMLVRVGEGLRAGQVT